MRRNERHNGSKYLKRCTMHVKNTEEHGDGGDYTRGSAIGRGERAEIERQSAE